MIPLQSHISSRILRASGRRRMLPWKGRRELVLSMSFDPRPTRPPRIGPTVRKTHNRQRARMHRIELLKEKFVHFLVSHWPTVEFSTWAYLSKAWIDSYEENDNLASLQPKRVSTPSRIHPAQHNSTPTQSSQRISLDGYVDSDDDTYNAISDKKVETGFFGGLREPVRGRKWDHARDAEPVIVKSGVQPNAAVWRTFIKASSYGVPEREDRKLVDQSFLDNLTPGYNRPWCGDLEKGEGDDDDNITSLIYNKRKRETFLRRVQVSSTFYFCGGRLANGI